MLTIACGDAAAGPAAVITWRKVQVAFGLPAVIATTCFALEYSYPGRWLTRRNLALLALPALLLIVLLLTNNARLVWRELEIAADGSLVVELAPLGTLLLAYALGRGLVGAAAFVWLFAHSPEHRWLVALMLFGEIGGRLRVESTQRCGTQVIVEL